MAKGNCEFRGNGGQYFIAVIIHLFILGVITFGIYSAWAWVRLLKLKANHTIINGKDVKFIGTGGQLFVLILIHGIILTFITLGFYGPWALCRFFRWMAENTIVGGKPSKFDGTGGSFFLFYLIHLFLLPLLTLGIYYFYGFYRLIAWKEEHTRYGGEKTSFGAGFGGFLKLSLICWILNTITLNLFTPWALCMYYRWQTERLAVGDKVEHFPPVKTGIFAIIILILISLLSIWGIYYLINTVVEKQLAGDSKFAAITDMKSIGTKAIQSQKDKLSKKPRVEKKKPKRKQKSTIDQARKEILLHETSPIKDIDREFKKAEDMINENSNSAPAYFSRARLFAYKGDIKKAIRDYSHAIRIDQAFSDAHYNRGLLYIVERQYSKAINDFSKVIELEPGAADAYCNRGNARYQLGKGKLAIRDYSAALKISPSDPDTLYNRGMAYLSEGQETKAMADLKRASRLGQKNATVFLKGSPARKREITHSHRTEASGQAGQWKMDLSRVQIPDSSVRGKIHGKAFNLEDAKIENGILTLREGKDFFADREIIAFLFLKKGETAEGKVFNIEKESGFSSPHIHMKWMEDGKDIPQVEMFMKDYAMRLTFGNIKGNILSGKIYICLPDDMKSFAAGSFNAKVK